ncbi:hypothetical protein EVAR_95677_1 [Eumeta japonica]|uniref:Uncharacterized protein n=1 Tax=Eumeta variegata TaxID=151549 RepID=A0A4C1VKW0_EUMVA|nr:hypothetical protein EVAR_95677_1 [Eumeta japonica]
MYLVVAFVPSLTACFANSPGIRRRTEVCASRRMFIIGLERRRFGGYTLENVVHVKISRLAYLGGVTSDRVGAYDKIFPIVKIKDGYRVVLFADDTSLLLKINGQQPAFVDVINNLLLNERTTRVVELSLTGAKLIDAKVMAKNEILDFVDTTLFLGLAIDAKLC